MKQNPVFKREDRVSSRSLRLPVILTLFNGILCAVALLNMYSVVEQVKSTASIQYTSFMEIYEFVASMEFALLMFIVPAVTAASISGERERQTLELMLTTQMTPAQIVMGKLLSALSTLMLLVVSSFPAIAMVFVFGGITLADMASLLICYAAAALFFGTLGLCLSAMFKRSTLATAAAYGLTAAIVAGTYILNRFALSMSASRLNSYVDVYGLGRNGLQPTSGSLIYLLLINPAATFYAVIRGQTGQGSGTDAVISAFGISRENWITGHWIGLSIVLQLAAAGIFLAAAVYFTDPYGRKRNKTR